MKYQTAWCEDMEYFYHTVLTQGHVIKSCKKKWFKQHYIVRVLRPDLFGYEDFHLTPNKTWSIRHVTNMRGLMS